MQVLDRALLSLPLQIRAELGKHLSLPCRSLDKVSSKAARVFQECYGFDVASFTDIFRLAALEPQKAACLKALPVLAGEMPDAAASLMMVTGRLTCSSSLLLMC